MPIFTDQNEGAPKTGFFTTCYCKVPIAAGPAITASSTIVSPIIAGKNSTTTRCESPPGSCSGEFISPSWVLFDLVVAGLPRFWRPDPVGKTGAYQSHAIFANGVKWVPPSKDVPMPEDNIKKQSPLCPNCGSDRTHRSRRNGPLEWIRHYLLFTSPYRCPACYERFFHSRLSHHPKKELNHHSV